MGAMVQRAIVKSALIHGAMVQGAMVPGAIVQGVMVPVAMARRGRLSRSQWSIVNGELKLNKALQIYDRSDVVKIGQCTRSRSYLPTIQAESESGDHFA